MASFVNIFPVILVAYKFYGHRASFLLVVYLVTTFIFAYFIQTLNVIEPIRYLRREVIISDVFLFLYNIGVIVLLFIVKDPIIKMKPIKNQVLQSQVLENEPKESVPVKILEYEIDAEKVNELVVKLEYLMEQRYLFKDSSIDISKISFELGVNYSFLSKVIRVKGYSNFSHYINTYRIEFVKKLLKETNLEKVTLMYIYTEAGFKNQSTFNRAFKQIEGITPSDYILGLKETKSKNI